MFQLTQLDDKLYKVNFSSRLIRAKIGEKGGFVVSKEKILALHMDNIFKPGTELEFIASGNTLVVNPIITTNE